MKIPLILASVILPGTIVLGSGTAVASYPDKSVRVLVGIAPGGGTDSVARLLTQKLSDALRQTFIVDNRPGAGGNVATELVAHAAPDGYTLLFVSPTFTVNPSLWQSVRYDPVKDFAPILQVASIQYFLAVRSSVPVNSVKDLIALAKSQPHKLSYGSTGIGSATHLAGELFKSMVGVDMVHVPYKGGGPAASALLAGEVQLMFGSGGGIIAHAKSGRLRVLAVTGVKRSATVPEIPTVAESGVPGFEVTGWYGMLTPAGTANAIIEKLNAASNHALPELRERYADLGAEVTGGTSADFGSFIKAEIAKWSRVVKLSGAKID
jgi:tripartite-type tricarboxylate transporter receptor subunit TctC